MSKVIKPKLFKIELEYWTEYVIAYDMVHALKLIDNVDNPSNEPSYVSISQITGQSNGVSDILKIAKECLPQGLINKIEK